jgi:hypothetical protein
MNINVKSDAKLVKNYKKSLKINKNDQNRHKNQLSTKC